MRDCPRGVGDGAINRARRARHFAIGSGANSPPVTVRVGASGAGIVARLIEPTTAAPGPLTPIGVTSTISVPVCCDRSMMCEAPLMPVQVPYGRPSSHADTEQDSMLPDCLHEAVTRLIW